MNENQKFFNERQIGDYKEMTHISFDKVVEYVNNAKEFLIEI